MNTCKQCGAKSRTNYPFGKNGGARIHFIIPHDKECQHRTKVRR